VTVSHIVYTHINFTFASIDPTTFAVLPSDPGDIDLYQQVILLNGQQHRPKIFIAIGGWTFNDPEPIETTQYTERTTWQHQPITKRSFLLL
jgi:hypothetical protein